VFIEQARKYPGRDEPISLPLIEIDNFDSLLRYKNYVETAIRETDSLINNMPEHIGKPMFSEISSSTEATRYGLDKSGIKETDPPFLRRLKEQKTREAAPSGTRYPLPSKPPSGFVRRGLEQRAAAPISSETVAAHSPKSQDLSYLKELKSVLNFIDSYLSLLVDATSIFEGTQAAPTEEACEALASAACSAIYLAMDFTPPNLQRQIASLTALARDMKIVHPEYRGHGSSPKDLEVVVPAEDPTAQAELERQRRLEDVFRGRDKISPLKRRGR
jgi:hypothetical protein